MSIFVCGDIHSTLDINKLDCFIGREDLNENDYLIICGDTGICGFNKEQERLTREYLRKLPMTILFADGNHEQFDALNSYSIDEWNGGKVHIIESGIMHLMRGQVYQIDGRKFFVFGGAYSNDRAYRNLGFTWFEEELPSEEEYMEAWKNLKANGYKVDYIISHTGPYEVITELGYKVHEEELDQVKFFQQIADRVDFQDWYFGHFHEDVDVENFHCRIDEVTQIEWYAGHYHVESEEGDIRIMFEDYDEICEDDKQLRIKTGIIKILKINNSIITMKENCRRTILFYLKHFTRRF